MRLESSQAAHRISDLDAQHGATVCPYKGMGGGGGSFTHGGQERGLEAPAQEVDLARAQIHSTCETTRLNTSEHASSG